MAKTGNIDVRGGRPLEAGLPVLSDAPVPAPPGFKRGATDSSIAQLTFRECEVLEALVRGLTNKQIGLELAISHRTVEVHRARLMRKLGAPTLAALLAAVLPQRTKLESLLRAQH
ncbi:LuxR C-terminal-related transcriptional regulator [Sphingopyxis fribergensis]